MTTNDDVLRIIEILDFRRQPEPIKKKRVHRWFESSEPNVIGAAVDAVLRNWERIEPSLTRREIGDLLMKNFGVSLDSRGQKVSNYAYNCHEAAKEFYGWVIASHAAFPDHDAKECVRVAKQFLEQRYRAGDEGQRNCIIAGALEHIFEAEGLQEVFFEWKRDPVLSDAYAKAGAWSSWVAARNRSLEPIATATAEALRRRGFEDVQVQRPAVGTTMPVVTWRNGQPHELAISGDEAWARRFDAGEVDMAKAARFAATPENWSQSSSLPTHFTVELNGDRFTAPR